MNAKEYLETKGVFALETKKRFNEVIEWLEEYSKCKIKEEKTRSTLLNKYGVSERERNELYSFLNSILYKIKNLSKLNFKEDFYENFDDVNFSLLHLIWEEKYSIDEAADKLMWLPEHTYRFYFKLIKYFKQRVFYFFNYTDISLSLFNAFKEVIKENQSWRSQFNSLPENKHLIDSTILLLSLSHFKLSNKLLNTLNNLNFKTVGDLVKYKKSDLIKIRGLGAIRINEIEEKIFNILNIELKY